MSQFSVKLYHPEYKALWDNFVSSAKNSTFLFYRDFMEYHQNRFDDFSLLIFKDDILVALLPANKAENSIYSHQGLTYGGLILNNKSKLYVTSKIFEEILIFLNSNGIRSLYIKEIPSMYCDLPSDELRYLMFILDAKLVRRDSLSVLKLESDFKISKDRIAGNKRAKKHNLIIQEEDDFESFWSTILIPNLKNKHGTVPVHSLKEIRLLKNRFPNNIRQFNVYRNFEIVAGTTIFETENVAHSQYISANQDKNVLGSLDFLHLELIRNIFKDKSYFDFGISNENNGLNINKGLLYWKEGFGARTLTQDFYSIDVSGFNKLKNIWI